MFNSVFITTWAASLQVSVSLHFFAIKTFYVYKILVEWRDDELKWTVNGVETLVWPRNCSWPTIDVRFIRSTYLSRFDIEEKTVLKIKRFVCIL